MSFPLHFLFLLPRPDPSTTSLVTAARSGLHRVSREHAVAVQEVGGGHRLLARELEEQQADGGSSGGDDEAVASASTTVPGGPCSGLSTGRVWWMIRRRGPFEDGSLEIQVVEQRGHGCMARTRL